MGVRVLEDSTGFSVYFLLSLACRLLFFYVNTGSLLFIWNPLSDM